MYRKYLLLCDKTIGLRAAQFLEGLICILVFLSSYFVIQSFEGVVELPKHYFLLPACVALVITLGRFIAFDDDHFRKMHDLPNKEQ